MTRRNSPPVQPASSRLERSGRDRTGRRPAPADDPPETTCDPEQFPGERHHRDSLDRLERAGPFNPPEDGDLAPDHDKT